MTSLTLPIGRQTEWALIVSIGVFAALMAALAAVAGGPDIWRHLARLDWALVAALLALSLLNYGLRTLRWHLYSHHLGISTSLKASAIIYFAGFALTTTPGRVGEALRLWLLQRMGGHRIERTLPLLVADRISDMGAVGLLMLIGLAAVSSQILLLFTAVLATSATLVLMFWPGLAIAAVGLAFRAIGRWPRLFGKIRCAARRTILLFAPRLALPALALGMLGWLAEALAFYLLLDAMGAPIGLLEATLIFTAGMLVGALTMVPGGVGGTEGAMLALLSLQGVPMSVAVPATIVIRVTTLWFAVALGFAAMPSALRLARMKPA
jgi:glycosyltransferase 2 family protein